MKNSNIRAVVDSIYSNAGRPTPLIIWTQSPLESYLAKAAIDVFSEAGQPYVWYYRWWDGDAERNVNFRMNAAQSILNSGWRMGQPGTGYDAWGEMTVYTGCENVLWKDIPPNSRARYDRSKECPAWTKRLKRANLSSLVDTVIPNYSNDMMVDMWARYRFQMDHIDKKPIGGSRNMHLSMMRDKKELHCQKNLSFFPVQVTHPETGEALRMTDEFIALREFGRHIMPYTDICFVSEAANSINIDNAGRLHCETGPAVVYLDGFHICAWHGVLFPKKWIDQKPDAWEASQLRDAEQRHVAYEMIGLENPLK